MAGGSELECLEDDREWNVREARKVVPLATDGGLVVVLLFCSAGADLNRRWIRIEIGLVSSEVQTGPALVPCLS